MEKFTRVIAKEDIKTFDDAGIAQLGNLNKIIDELGNGVDSLQNEYLGPVQFTKVVISSAEIATLFTNEVLLIPAPTNLSTEYIIIEKLIVEMTQGAPGVVTANTVRIGDNFTTHMWIDSSFFTPNRPVYVVTDSAPMLGIVEQGTTRLIPAIGRTEPVAILRDVFIRMNTGNPTGITTQIMTVKIWYRIGTIG